MKNRKKISYICRLNLKKVKTLFDASFYADFKSVFKNKKILKFT